MRIYFFGLILLLAGSVPLRGQPLPAVAGTYAGPSVESELGTELRVVPSNLMDAWLELTPLVGDTAAQFWNLGDLEEDDDALLLDSQLPSGPALLCTRAQHLGVRCEEVYLDRAVAVDIVGLETVEVSFSFGVPVQGTFLLGRKPLEGVRVSVVPAGLAAARPFTLPLFLHGSSGGLSREVESDGEGHFELPPLAEGTYFLEAVLPSGRIFRGDPFALPAIEVLEVETAAEVDERVVWDLGLLDVAEGLILEVHVLDREGRPLTDVRVSARQGDFPTNVVTYELTTDEEGVAFLGGLGVESSLFIALEAPGYRPVRQEHELAPALLTVVLEPLAALTGEVLGFDGLVPSGAVVSVENLSVREAATSLPPPTALLPEILPTANSPRAIPVAATGEFTVDALVAGGYRLKVTAPGFEVREIEINLEPGDVVPLAPFLLAPGRAVAGRVVDAETGEGISGADLRIVDPPGAALTFTDAEGDFEFATASDRAITVRATAEGYASASLKLTPGRLVDDEPLKVVLERGGWILALVFEDAIGSPCQGCPLKIQPGGIELVTNAQGEALSPSLAPGAYRVVRPSLTHLGSMVIEEPEASLRYARVERDGIAVVRFEALRRALEVRFTPRVGHGTRLRARRPGGEEVVLPDAEGKFTLQSRPGEILDLFLHLYDPATDRESQIYQGVLLGPEEGKTIRHDLPRRATEIFGRVRVDQKPVGQVRVRLQTLTGATRGEVWTNAEGTFRVPHMLPGVYVLVVGQRAVHFASLANGQQLDLGTFDLIAGSY